MFRIALKSTLARKGRLFLTAGAVIAGCAFLSGVFVFSDTIRASFNTLFASAYAGADLTRIRTLIRNAQKETKEGKPPRDYRELYRAIRDAMAARQATAQPDTPEEAGAPE